MTSPLSTPSDLSRRSNPTPLQSLEATFEGEEADKHTPRAKGWVDGVKQFWSKVTA